MSDNDYDAKGRDCCARNEALTAAEARVAQLEAALRGLREFYAEDFPDGNVRHPQACVTPAYRSAVVAAEDALSDAPPPQGAKFVPMERIYAHMEARERVVIAAKEWAKATPSGDELAELKLLNALDALLAAEASQPKEETK